MRHSRPFALAASVFGLSAGAWTCAAQETAGALEATLEALRERNESLEKSLLQANRAEKEASEQLVRVRQRLEALGRDLLDGGDERLVQATSDLQVLGSRVASLESASTGLVSSVSEYIRQAVAADPDARLRVETAIRELDEVLGLRQKPAPAAAGSAGQAKVVSIDSESGLLVLNVGESQGARIGTTYRLTRGEQPFGSAIVADVRRNVCGAFVEELESGSGPVRLGDSATLITE
jgi:Arc/MetJ-type ribon-helix-helix transcriptional regulator